MMYSQRDEYLPSLNKHWRSKQNQITKTHFSTTQHSGKKGTFFLFPESTSNTTTAARALSLSLSLFGTSVFTIEFRVFRRRAPPRAQHEHARRRSVPSFRLVLSVVRQCPDGASPTSGAGGSAHGVREGA